MIHLSQLKSDLFNLNLSSHNFLAELSCSESVDQAHIKLATHIKESVLELYNSWDQSHHRISGCLVETEAAVKKLQQFEDGVVELRNLLHQDALYLNDKCRRKISTKSGKKIENSSGDSGISDSSGGNFSDHDIPLREQHLSKLKIMAEDLEKDLSPDSSVISMISQTLHSTLILSIANPITSLF